MNKLHDLLVYALGLVLFVMSFYISFAFYHAEELLDIINNLEILCSTLLMLYFLKGAIKNDEDIGGTPSQKAKAVILAYANAYVLFTFVVEIAILICSNIGKSFERDFTFLFILNIILALGYFVWQLLVKKNKLIYENIQNGMSKKMQKKRNKSNIQKTFF
jgi:hypothetical protein